MLNRRFSISLTAILAVLFVAGVAWMFAQRFQAGNVYPPYSSLRTDPLGCKALYESFGERNDVFVRRNFQPLDQLDKMAVSGNCTLFFIGARADSFDAQKELGALARNGARVVVTFLPEAKRKPETNDEKEKSANREPAKKPAKSAPADDSNKKKTDQKKSDDAEKKDLDAEWNVVFCDLESKSEGSEMPSLTAISTLSEKRLEPSLSWHTALYFQCDSPAWKTLYRSEKNPVIIERAFGRGSIVLVADSYLLSNEALRQERAPHLLLRLADGPLTAISAPHREIVFDESHLGVEENPNIATLARQFHLEGVAASLLILAALFIWRNAAPLLPPYRDEEKEPQVAGRDVFSGFVNLLRRSIPVAQLPAVCVGEWKKSFAGQYSAEKLREIDAVAAANHDPDDAYREIAKLIRQKDAPRK